MKVLCRSREGVARELCAGAQCSCGVSEDRASACMVSTRRLKSAREIVGPLFAACGWIGVKGGVGREA